MWYNGYYDFAFGRRWWAVFIFVFLKEKYVEIFFSDKADFSSEKPGRILGARLQLKHYLLGQLPL